MHFKLLASKHGQLFDFSKYKASPEEFNRTYVSDHSSPFWSNSAVCKHSGAFGTQLDFQNDPTLILFEEFGNFIESDNCSSNPEKQSLTFLNSMIVLSYYPSMALKHSPALVKPIQQNVLLEHLKKAEESLTEIKDFQTRYSFNPDHFSTINKLIEYVILGVIKNIENNPILKDCICDTEQVDGKTINKGTFSMSANEIGLDLTGDEAKGISLCDYILLKLEKMGWNNDKTLKNELMIEDQKCGEFKIFGRDSDKPNHSPTKVFNFVKWLKSSNEYEKRRTTQSLLNKLFAFNEHPLPSFRTTAAVLAGQLLTESNMFHGQSNIGALTSATNSKAPSNQLLSGFNQAATKYATAHSRYIPSMRENGINDVAGDGNCYYWATAKQMVDQICLPENKLGPLPPLFIDALNNQLKKHGSTQLTAETITPWIRENKLTLTSYGPGQASGHSEAENYFRLVLRDLTVLKLDEMIKNEEPLDSVLKGQERRSISDMIGGFLSDNDSFHPNVDAFEELKTECVQFSSKGASIVDEKPVFEAYATGLNLERFHRGLDTPVLLEKNPDHLQTPSSGDLDAYRAKISTDLQDLVDTLIDLVNESINLPGSDAEILVFKFVKEVNRNFETDKLKDAIQAGLDRSSKTIEEKEIALTLAKQLISNISQLKKERQDIGFDNGSAPFFDSSVTSPGSESNLVKYHRLRKEALTEIRNYAQTDGKFMGQESSIILSTIFTGVRFVAKSHNIDLEPPYYTSQMTVQFNGNGYDYQHDLGNVPTIAVVRVATQNHFNSPPIENYVNFSEEIAVDSSASPKGTVYSDCNSAKRSHLEAGLKPDSRQAKSYTPSSSMEIE